MERDGVEDAARDWSWGRGGLEDGCSREVTGGNLGERQPVLATRRVCRSCECVIDTPVNCRRNTGRLAAGDGQESWLVAEPLLTVHAAPANHQERVRNQASSNQRCPNCHRNPRIGDDEISCLVPRHSLPHQHTPDKAAQSTRTEIALSVSIGSLGW